MRSLPVLAAASILLGGLTLPAFAQEAERREPPADQAGERRAREPVTAESLRARLARRLEESERNHRRLQEAVQRLDKGEAPLDVLRDIESALRPGLEERGQRDERGPRDGPRDGRGGPPGGDLLNPDGPPRGEHAGDRRPGEGPEPTPVDPEKARAFVRENFPELWRRYEELRTSNPEIAERVVGRVMPRVREALAIREQDPELFELRIGEIRVGINAMAHIREYRESRALPESDAGRAARLAKAEEDLRATLTEGFDLRLRLQEHELKMLTAKVEGLRKEIESRRGERDQTVKSIFDRVKDDKDGPPEGQRRRGRPEGGAAPKDHP